ncbi:anti-sigma factor antagonist [Occultella glacieicola]|uniref:Anti-sigma factor antagonist n=1 Tax=Occultella glacieicola TaxID=2518684 RepID=A0ABY2E2C5_9MICO|nr:STAS domain-containing protein [Occultella glacieicola]TDE92759.1 anti-sigma factor antagonist [Occultella glacieicola]
MGGGTGAILGSVEVHEAGPTIRLRLRGEVDITMNRRLADVAEEIGATSKPVELHVGEVTFMDSAVLAIVARLAYRLPTPLRIVDPPGFVLFLLEVSQLVEVVEIVETEHAVEVHDEPGPTSREPGSPAPRSAVRPT